MPSLKKLSRADLNAKATELGIDEPEKLGNRAAVIAAIEEKKAADAAANPFGPSAKCISVFGPFNSRALIEVPADLALRALGPLADNARTGVIDGVERDLAEIAERDEELAKSTLAGVAIRLALELDHPYNSATSKGQCAKALNETMDRLRELAPEEEANDGVDDLAARRKARLEGGAAAKA